MMTRARENERVCVKAYKKIDMICDKDISTSERLQSARGRERTHSLAHNFRCCTTNVRNTAAQSRHAHSSTTPASKKP